MTSEQVTPPPHPGWISELFDYLPCATILLCNAGTIFYLNQATASLLEIPQSRLQGRSLLPLLTAESQRRLARQFVAATKQNAGDIVTEFPVAFSASSIGPLQARLTRLRDVPWAGYCLSLCPPVPDAMSDTIEQANKIKTAIVDACLDTLVTINMDDVIVEFSAAGEAMFGWRRDEVLGKKMSSILIPHEMREAHHRGMEHYRKTSEGPLLGKLVEVEALHRDGHRIPVELGLVPIRLSDELLVTAFLRDISERKRTELALLEEKDKAHAASLAKSRFLSHMSHEIRTPLNGLLGAITLLQDKLITEDQHRYCEIAKSSGQTLLSIINEILDFSKIEAGHIRLHKEDTPVEQLLDDVLIVADSKRDSHARLAGYIHPRVPPTLEIDPLKVKQVITIFLDNALKFTETGLVQVRLSWQAGASPQHEDQFVLQVKDTGIGIAPERQQSVFFEFEQVDAIRDSSIGGTGLGLAIAQKLVGLMGGQIELDSEPDQGSCFTVKLPMCAKPSTCVPCLTTYPLPVVLYSAQPAVLRFLADVLLDHGLPKQQLTLCHELSELTDHMHQNGDTHHWLLDLSAERIDELALGEKNRLITLLGDPREAYDHLPAGYAFLEQPVTSAKLINQLLGKKTSPPVRIASPRKQGEAHLLLVEDIDINRAVARAMLENRGYRVTEAKDGVAALEILSKNTVDLILMDMRMPRLNGLDTSIAIRAQQGPNAATPIIALTANAESGEIKRCVEAGMNGFVSKPFQLEQLVATIEQTLSQDKSNAQ